MKGPDHIQDSCVALVRIVPESRTPIKQETFPWGAGLSFKNNHEFLAFLEEEMKVWVSAFMVRHKLIPVEDEDPRMLEEEAKQKEAARHEALEQSNSHIPWKKLISSLGLNRLEEMVLGYLFCLAESSAFNQFIQTKEYEIVGQFRLDDWNSIGRILSIFCPDSLQAMSARKIFSVNAPLFAHGVLKALELDRHESLVRQAVELNSDVAAAILDDEASFSHIRTVLRVEHPREDFSMLVLDDGVKKLLYDIARHHDEYEQQLKRMGLDDQISYGRGTILLFHGPPGTGKTLSARAMAGETGKPLITLNLSEANSQAQRNVSETLKMALDEAHRSHGILLLDECEDFFGEEGSWRCSNHEMLDMLERAEGLVVLSTNFPLLLSTAIERRILYKIAFTFPNRQDSERIWRLHLPGLAGISDAQISRLASRYHLSGGYIKNAVLQAAQLAVSRKASGCDKFRGLTFETIELAAKDQARRLMSRLCPGKLIETGDVSEWDALFSAEDSSRIDEVAALARRFLEDNRMALANQVVLERGLRILYLGQEAGTLLRAAHATARRLGMNLIDIRSRDLIEKSNKKSRTTTITPSTYEFFRSVRRQLVLLVRLEAPKQDGHRDYDEVLDVLTQLDCFVLAVAPLRGRPIDKSWFSCFHRLVRFSELQPAENAKHFLSLVERSGWHHNLDKASIATAGLPSDPDEMERVFLEAVNQAIIRKADILSLQDISKAVGKRRDEIGSIRNTPLFGSPEQFS